MSKAIRYVECAHCGETVGSYYTSPALTAGIGWWTRSKP